MRINHEHEVKIPKGQLHHLLAKDYTSWFSAAVSSLVSYVLAFVRRLSLSFLTGCKGISWPGVASGIHPSIVSSSSNSQPAYRSSGWLCFHGLTCSFWVIKRLFFWKLQLTVDAAVLLFVSLFSAAASGLRMKGYISSNGRTSSICLITSCDLCCWMRKNGGQRPRHFFIPGLDNTRPFMSFTAGAGTRCMSLLSSSPNL